MRVDSGGNGIVGHGSSELDRSIAITIGAVGYVGVGVGRAIAAAALIAGASVRAVLGRLACTSRQWVLPKGSKAVLEDVGLLVDGALLGLLALPGKPLRRLREQLQHLQWQFWGHKAADALLLGAAGHGAIREALSP